ncbi:class I SAM-dependent methyltransferase [Nocardiopsis mangrovi]|uniref:Class I SAM-dependent methyltransferase n=1 Tax=Nocardiopsis mangrovi TaxID=1179818 RepID=A0ABV9DT35_9ACTN
MPVSDAGAMREAAEREFTRQAASFEDARLNTAFTVHLDRLADFAAPRADDVCLDSACGTGLVARRLALRARQVTALDTTPEMLRTGKAAADAEGIGNVVFQRGDAARLPFLDDSFSLAVSRFSLHHVASPAAVVAELVRVCRPGGRVVLADMVVPDGLTGAPDRFERLRDPSHGAMLRVDAIRDLLREAGADAGPSEVFDVPRPVRPWLRQAGTPEDTARRIERILARELVGGAPTGLRPHSVDGDLWFTQTWAHIAASPLQ